MISLIPKIRHFDLFGDIFEAKHVTEFQQDYLSVFKLMNRVNMKNLREEIKMMSVNQIAVYHTLLEAYNVMRHLSSEQIQMKWKLVERKYALRSITKKKLNVPEKPKLKCLGFTYNGAKLFYMLPLEMKHMEDPNIFKTKTKEWIWENIPSY